MGTADLEDMKRHEEELIRLKGRFMDILKKNSGTILTNKLISELKETKHEAKRLLKTVKYVGEFLEKEGKDGYDREISDLKGFIRELKRVNNKREYVAGIVSEIDKVVSETEESIKLADNALKILEEATRKIDVYTKTVVETNKKFPNMPFETALALARKKAGIKPEELEIDPWKEFLRGYREGYKAIVACYNNVLVNGLERSHILDVLPSTEEAVFAILKNHLNEIKGKNETQKIVMCGFCIGGFFCVYGNIIISDAFSKFLRINYIKRQSENLIKKLDRVYLGISKTFILPGLNEIFRKNKDRLSDIQKNLLIDMANYSSRH